MQHKQLTNFDAAFLLLMAGDWASSEGGSTNSQIDVSVTEALKYLDLDGDAPFALTMALEPAGGFTAGKPPKQQEQHNVPAMGPRED